MQVGNNKWEKYFCDPFSFQYDTHYRHNSEEFTLRKKPSTRPIIKMKGHQHWWLAGGYDLEIGHFRER